MSLMGPPGAILLLLFAAAVTPGPNNLLMLRIGLESGLHAVLAPATGVVLGGVGHLGIPGTLDRAVHPQPFRVPLALGRWRFAGGQPVARDEGPRAPGALGRRDARAVGAAAAVPAMMGAHARPHAAAGEAAG